MANKKFEKAINYGIQHISDYNESYTSNLSSLMYNINVKSFPLLMNHCFNIGLIFSPIDCIEVEPTTDSDYTISTQTVRQTVPKVTETSEVVMEDIEVTYEKKEYLDFKISVQPDLQELAKAFGYDMPNVIVKDTEVKYIRKDYAHKLAQLVESIRIFIAQRNDYLDGKRIHLTNIPSFSMDKEKELRDVIQLLNKTLPETKLEIKDYFYKPDGMLGRLKEEIKVASMHSYTSLREECKKIALQESDYYNYFYNLEKIIKDKENYQNKLLEATDRKMQTFFRKRIEKCDEFIDKANEILDKINESSVFTRETFAILYILLEPFVKQEETLNNFIKKILDRD